MVMPRSCLAASVAAVRTHLPLHQQLGLLHVADAAIGRQVFLVFFFFLLKSPREAEGLCI